MEIGFWIKGLCYCERDGSRIYLVDDSTILYDERQSPISGEGYLLPLSRVCSIVAEHFMASKTKEDRVYYREGRVCSNPTKSHVGDALRLVNPLMNISRGIHNKKGVLLCHGREHKPPLLYEIRNVNWIYIDLDKSARADLVVDVLDTDRLVKVLGNDIDLIVTQFCSLINETEIYSLLRSCHAVLKKGGMLYFNTAVFMAIREIYSGNHSLYRKKYVNGDRTVVKRVRERCEKWLRVSGFSRLETVPNDTGCIVFIK